MKHEVRASLPTKQEFKLKSNISKDEPVISKSQDNIKQIEIGHQSIESLNETKDEILESPKINPVTEP